MLPITNKNILETNLPKTEVSNDKINLMLIRLRTKNPVNVILKELSYIFLHEGHVFVRPWSANSEIKV